MDNIIEFPKDRKIANNDTPESSLGLEAARISESLGYKGAMIVTFNNPDDLCMGTYGLEFEEQCEALGIFNFYVHSTQYEIPHEEQDG